MMAVMINVAYTDSDTSCFVFITRINHIILCLQMQVGDGIRGELCGQGYQYHQDYNKFVAKHKGIKNMNLYA